MKTDRKAQGQAAAEQSNNEHRSSAESQLNAKHQHIINQHLPLGIVETSLDGMHLDASEEFRRPPGHERGELLRRGIKDVTHEQDFHIDSELHGQLIAGEIPYYQIEKRFVRKDDRVLWAKLTRYLISDDRDSPLYAVGMALEGTSCVQTAPGAGTRIEVAIPLPLDASTSSQEVAR